MSNELSGDSTLVGAWSDIPNDKKCSDLHEGSPLSETNETDSSVDLSTSTEIDKRDVKQSLLLLHSSRRRRHGSAVVLNSQKMQKILRGRNDEDTNSPSELEVTVVAEAVSEIRRPHFYLSKAAIKIQQCWRNHYYTQIRQNLEFRYSQGGKWTRSQSDRVFSLILGWRIRYLMRSKRIEKIMKSLTDVYKVLSEVITSSTNSSPASQLASRAASNLPEITSSATTYADKLKMLDTIRQLSRNQSTQSSISSKITYADRLLVDHLVKEALLMRSAINKILFEDCCWQSFNTNCNSEYYSEVSQGTGSGSGFWDFSSAVQIVLNTSPSTAERITSSTKAISSASFTSPKRKGSVQSPSISRSESRQNGEHSSLENHWLGDSHDDAEFKCTEDTDSTHVPEEVSGFDRSQPIKRRVNAPFSEFPPDVGRGEDRPCTGLSETGESVIQSQLALLRGQAMRKKSVGAGLGLSAAEEDDYEGDKGGKARGPPVPRKTAVSSSKAVPTTSSGKTPETEPVRPENCRACIQLDILHADRLMPAKKGSVARDAYGNMVPDRKPCLQVTLLMPPPTISPAKSKRPKPPGGNQGNSVAYDSDDEEEDDSRTKPEELKKTHYIHREFTEITLNPRWKAGEKKEGGSVFYLPLPCPKKIILNEAALSGDAGLLSESISDFSYTNDFTSGPSMRSAEEKDGLYSRACRSLLEHWGQGLVKIQIVDGERFNEDIFMGEVTLRLSTFLVPQAVSKKSALSSGGSGGQAIHELSGTYQLSKAKASDRVSGSLTLHAYLHMPDASYIEGIRTASMPQPLPQSVPLVPQRRHTAAARVAWTDPSAHAAAAGAVSVTAKRGVGPTDLALKSDEPVEGSTPVDDWDEDDDDVLELSYAPHSPKVAESPDRRLFRTRPAVCSFGVHGHHGPDAKSKMRMRPAGADGSGSIANGPMSLAQSELVGGSKKLGFDFNDGSDSDGDAAGEEGDEWDPSGLTNLKHGISPSRSAVKGLVSKSTASSISLNMNRQSMLDGVSKCLDGLSLAQDGADNLLERMQKQLAVRQSAKIAKEGDKSPPRRTKSESCIVHGKAKADDSFYADTPSQSILNPTPRKAKAAGNMKEKEWEKEKDKERDRGKERAKDKDKENVKEGDEKFQVYKAVKVAARSNFLSLSPAPVSLSPPPPTNTAPSPFRDVTDLADSLEGEDTRADLGEEDDESESVDSSEMIVIASTGFTITKNSSGVEHMTSDPTPASLGVRLFGSRPDSPPSTGRFLASVPPSLSPLLEGEDSCREGEDGPSMSEGWRKRNIEREKRSANTSPVRSTLH